MNRVKILIMCLISTFSIAQNKANKLKQTNKVNKDVTVDLNTNYVQIEVDTWNKDEISVEAYLESEKLSEAELKEALKEWNLNIETSPSNVLISSKGNLHFPNFKTESYDNILKDLELSLADLPEMPKVYGMPNMPKFPEMPELPELPELPEGVSTIKFDYDKYKEEGESYLKEWSKKYEKKGGKEMRSRMENWVSEFDKSNYKEKMKKWGEDFGERFGKEWGEKMEVWGRKMNERMESNKNRKQKRAKLMEKRKEKMNKIAKRRAEVNLERSKSLAERKQASSDRKQTLWLKKFGKSYSDSNIKRVIKIKIPKKAKLKLNVRHGELKMASLLSDIQGDVSHAFLVAEHIDGSDTSINVSHSPVVINKWDFGILNLNYVNKAHIKTADNLVLNSKSSNVSIDNLINTGIIDGNFGDLTISNLAETFKNLNLILENSDALISIPQSVNYNLHFKGNRSKYNNIPTTKKTINNSNKEKNKNIIVNAKFSNVIVN